MLFVMPCIHFMATRCVLLQNKCTRSWRKQRVFSRRLRRSAAATTPRRFCATTVLRIPSANTISNVCGTSSRKNFARKLMSLKSQHPVTKILGSPGCLRLNLGILAPIME